MKILKRILGLLALSSLAFANQSCDKIIDSDDDIVIDPNPRDTVKVVDAIYDGMLSQMALDINDSREIDIWTEYESFPAITINRAESIKIVTTKDFMLLANADRYENDEFKPRPSLVALEKGEEIYRGEEEVAYEQDYWYGPEYYTVYANYNLMTDDIKYWDGEFTNSNVNTKYIALAEVKNGNWHFGWIEISIEPEIMFTDGGMDGAGFGFGDAKVKVTDSYINPEQGLGVKAGFKN
ncbi:MAG: hypothetical protein Kapaf2KO_21780 [Candidatus Kapaibacteriales bacterium]